jgi:DNA-binding NarL/FixJ family response regulator
MNQLEVSLQQTIIVLHGRGWSQRRIARELKLDRGTVAGYVRAAKPAISTP